MLDNIVKKELIDKFSDFGKESTHSELTGFAVLDALSQGTNALTSMKEEYEAELKRMEGDIIEDPL